MENTSKTDIKENGALLNTVINSRLPEMLGIS
jgi:hypothetical protein